MAVMLDTLEKLLTWDEGRRSYPYLDPRGIWTVGIGHNLEANPLPEQVVASLYGRLGRADPAPSAYPQNKDLIESARGLLDSEIDELFSHDLITLTGFLDGYAWFTELDGPRQAALRDMAFNLGASKFLQFDDFLYWVSEKDWDLAADDLRRTRVYRELPARYERIASMIAHGEWPTV